MENNNFKYQASKGNVLVAKDKSFVYGNVVISNVEMDLIEVTEAKAEEIRKSIEEEMMKKYQEGLNNI